MGFTHWLIFILVGAVAGWLAAILIRGRGMGLIGDVIVGVVGSVIGGWLFGYFHIAIGTGFVADIIAATAGAVLLLLVIKLVRKL